MPLNAQVSIKSTDATSAGALTFQNTPATGSSPKSWTLQPKDSTITSDGYSKLVVYYDGSDTTGEDTEYPQFVLAGAIGATQSTTAANGLVSGLRADSVSCLGWAGQGRCLCGCESEHVCSHTCMVSPTTMHHMHN